MLIKSYFIKGFFLLSGKLEISNFLRAIRTFVIPEKICNNYEKFVIVGSYVHG